MRWLGLNEANQLLHNISSADIVIIIKYCFIAYTEETVTGARGLV